MEKRIGKIQKATFGHGGYQDSCIGISFTLGSSKDCWGVSDFWGTWAMKRSASCKWTEVDRIKTLGETVMRLNKTMSEAKVGTVDALIGVPVEVTFDGNTLKEWRVLTEAV